MLPDWLITASIYAGAMVSALGYIRWLQTLKQRYGRAYHDLLFLAVIGGTALTGAWVWLLFRVATPTLPPSALIWWSYRQWVYMFLATGLPVSAVEIDAMRRRYVEALEK
jgi:hypothetical protein